MQQIITNKFRTKIKEQSTNTNSQNKLVPKANFPKKKKTIEQIISYQQNVTEKKEKKIEIRGNGGSRLPSKRGC